MSESKILRQRAAGNMSSPQIKTLVKEQTCPLNFWNMWSNNQGKNYVRGLFFPKEVVKVKMLPQEQKKRHRKENIAISTNFQYLKKINKRKKKKKKVYRNWLAWTTF